MLLVSWTSMSSKPSGQTAALPSAVTIASECSEQRLAGSSESEREVHVKVTQFMADMAAMQAAITDETKEVELTKLEALMKSASDAKTLQLDPGGLDQCYQHIEKAHGLSGQSQAGACP